MWEERDCHSEAEDKIRFQGHRPSKDKCGNILWHQKGQEKGFERKQVCSLENLAGTKMYFNEPKLPFIHTEQDSSGLT